MDVTFVTVSALTPTIFVKLANEVGEDFWDSMPYAAKLHQVILALEP